jgi:hypothetical protein
MRAPPDNHVATQRFDVRPVLVIGLGSKSAEVLGYVITPSSGKRCDA